MTQKYQIMCPSYKRGSQCITHKYLPDLHYVVDSSEAEEYQALHDKVIVLPDGVQGRYARVCNWILNNTDATNIVIIDDDLRHIGRYENTRKKNLTPTEALEFIESGCNLAEELDVHYWGMNILPDKGAYREYTPFAFTAYLGGPFQVHRKNQCRYDEKMLLKEDYDMTLQVLNKYRKNLRFNMYHFVCAQHTNSGGCASYRTIAKEKKQNELLQKKWGSKIVRWDNGNSSVNRRKKMTFDINPIIKVPIGGV